MMLVVVVLESEQRGGDGVRGGGGGVYGVDSGGVRVVDELMLVVFLNLRFS
ncbi:hypothetical protein Hdeb2414_s0016g00480921 [Helianthus debilis subsp. tardiflorus]